MLNIQPKVHTSTIVTSLNKANKLAEVYGELEVNDLYVVDSVYKLLNTLCLDLSNNQRRQLISIYNKIAFKSKNICTNVLLDSFSNKEMTSFVQNFTNIDKNSKNLNVAYWKGLPSQTFEEIVNTLVNVTELIKPEVSRTTAVSGFDIQLDGVGRYCFFLHKVKNINSVSIKDSMNNNITSYFNHQHIDGLNGLLLVTNNMHTSEMFNIKIIINESD